MSKLVVGLGNPGKEYSNTRHNVGVWVVERVAQSLGVELSKKSFSSLWGKAQVKNQDVFFQFPQTYMNRSGSAVLELMSFYRMASKDVVLVHDDLDLVLGRVKWGFDSSAAGHRGVLSTIEKLGTKAFHRLRVGIGRPERKEEVESFVLSAFKKDEFAVVQQGVEAATVLLTKWISEDS